MRHIRQHHPVRLPADGADPRLPRPDSPRRLIRRRVFARISRAGPAALQTLPAKGPKMSIRMQDIGKAVLETEYAVRGPIVARAQRARAAGPRDHLLQHRQPPGPRAEAAHLPAAGARALPVPRPHRARRRTSSRPTCCETAAADPRGHAGTASAPTPRARACASSARRWPTSSSERDGIDADPEAIYLTDGACKGVQTALRILIGGPQRRDHDPHPAVPALLRHHHALRGQAGRLLPRRGPRLEAQPGDARGEPPGGRGARREGEGHLRASTPATPPARCSTATTSR